MLITYFCLPSAHPAIYWGYTAVLAGLYPDFLLQSLSDEADYFRGCY